MNNLSSYCELVNAKIRASDKNLPVQDPANKQYFTPDAKMAPVFGTEKIRAFGMAKYLTGHLTPIKELGFMKQEKKEPGFEKQEPGFEKQEPEFVKQEPGFVKQEPGFMKQDPGFVKQDPGFVKQEPVFVKHEREL